MNEFEENIYKDIKNKLIHYYIVGMMIVNTQDGMERAKYGDGLIKKISERLTKKIGKGYSTRTLKLMRKYYLFQKGQPVVVQLS